MTAFALDIPVINTERLVLRSPREADFEAHAAYSASERARFTGGPMGRFDAWRGFLGVFGHWVLRGYGMWTAEMRDGGEVVGRTGFLHHDGWEEPELGWHLYDGFEGQGLASEATRAVRRYGAVNFGLDAVVSHIDHDNSRSIALAERIGAVCEGEGTLLGKPCLNYRHPTEEAA